MRMMPRGPSAAGQSPILIPCLKPIVGTAFPVASGRSQTPSSTGGLRSVGGFIAACAPQARMMRRPATTTFTYSAFRTLWDIWYSDAPDGYSCKGMMRSKVEQIAKQGTV